MWLKYLFSIITLPYYLVLRTRHFLFDNNLLKSEEPKGVVSICLGNLNLGGTGKTPTTVALAKMLSKEFNVAILSRGYGRKSKGFYPVKVDSDVSIVGDEALEMAEKTNLDVFVCEDRLSGIDEITKLNPKTQVILLDDAFQHRKLKASFSILLTLYNKPYPKDFLFPIGGLRDIRFAARRANWIMVSKCKYQHLSNEEINQFQRIIPRQHGEDLFFSKTAYSPNLGPDYTTAFPENKNVCLVSSIAKPEYLVKTLVNKGNMVKHCRYKDHHNFTSKDLKEINNIINSFAEEDCMAICTAKDYHKLKKAGKKAGIIINWKTVEITTEIINDKSSIFEEKLIDTVKAKVSELSR